MALTTATQNQLYQFFAIAFDAAPGVTYMSQLTDAVNAGMTVPDIVEVFTTKTQFTSVYPNFYTSNQFATKLIDNVVGNSAAATAKAAAVADVEAALTAGWSRGQVVYQIFSNLAAKPETDATWGNTAKMMANQVAVAKYVTETQLVDTVDLTTLKGFLANVTAASDVSTPAAIQAITGAATSAAIPGQTFTLTTGVEVITPDQADSTKKSTSGDDTFRADATADSLNTTDTIDGGAGNDTLNVLFVDETNVQPVLKNVEKIVLSDVTGTTASSLKLTDATGVQEVWVKTSGAGGATMTVSDVALTTKLGVTGTISDHAVFTYKAADVAGTSDTGTLLVKEAVAAGAVKVSALGVETLNMVVSDDSTTTGNVSTLNSLIITNTKTLNITGEAGTLTLGDDASTTAAVADFAALTKVDASGLKGNFNLDLTDASSAGVVIPTAGVTLLPSNTGTNTLAIKGTNNLADVLKFTSANVSTINKLTTLGGFDEAAEDKLDVSAFALGADTTVGATAVAVAGDIAGFFTGTNRVLLNDTTDTVYVDINKDGNFSAGTDLAVVLTGVSASGFTAADLILA